MEWILLLFVAVILWIWISAQNKKKRRESLLEKYGDLKIVNMIMDRMIWQGQTEEQLLDSLGKPLAIDQKVLKTKTKETWKYNSTGRNRYGLRIVVENGLVVGWDQKN